MLGPAQAQLLCPVQSQIQQQLSLAQLSPACFVQYKFGDSAMSYLIPQLISCLFKLSILLKALLHLLHENCLAPVGNSMSTLTLFRVGSGICLETILIQQQVKNIQKKPINRSEYTDLKKLWPESCFSPFGLSHIVSFTNRSVFDQIDRFKKYMLT